MKTKFLIFLRVIIFIINTCTSKKVHGEPEYKPASTPVYKIVFYSNRNGNNLIYKMNIDGSGLAKLTYNSSSDYNPIWSPDGQKIVFMSDRENNLWKIYIMNSNGRNQKRLTYSGNNINPVWQP